MRPTPTMAAIVGGLLTCTLLAPPTAADADPYGSGPTEKTVTDGTTSGVSLNDLYGCVGL